MIWMVKCSLLYPKYLKELIGTASQGLEGFLCNLSKKLLGIDLEYFIQLKKRKDKDGPRIFIQDIDLKRVKKLQQYVAYHTNKCHDQPYKSTV